MLLTMTVLSIYKPWGRTPYGRRIHLGLSAASGTGRERGTDWGRFALIAVAALLALMIILHLVGGGFRGH